ncbi:hypothetical protein PR202_gb14186 [Eleusine coracana subsp. coracana]|uniref:DNA-directed RNA polymerase n=1 Tax=Eleusine coracana subsp. coracana TaxID=191504 RepID=A0AAV5EVL9_ELECO|nr:hypothetical protein PR202_gb14186 [Eleusine coracana subsp. coracana]
MLQERLRFLWAWNPIPLTLGSTFPLTPRRGQSPPSPLPCPEALFPQTPPSAWQSTPSRPTPLSHGGGVLVPTSYGSPLGRHLRRGPSGTLGPVPSPAIRVPSSHRRILRRRTSVHRYLRLFSRVLLATSACAMEEPPKDNVQSLSDSDSELEPMTVDNNGAERSHYMDGANCESPIDVDEGQSPIDVDEGQSSVDVDMKGKSILDDDTKGRSSLESRAQVPVEFSVKSLEKFCREASRSFFDEIGLISHQINSYNEFISHGLQELFDSLGEVIVEPGYDPSKKGSGGWKHAIIKFGRVKLEKPVFWSGKDEADISFKPRHARLQNMTYASRMKAEVTIQVYSLEKSDKSKTGDDGFVQKRDFISETHWISIGRLPVMVKSNLCWLHNLKESDCLFDSGGYFLVKGMEKVPPLCISSDKEAFDVIDLQDCDASVINTITMTIKESDEVCEGFRKSNKARQYVDELIKSSRFPPAESFDDYVARYLFPGISGNRNKALFLGYMVKCLLMAFIGKRKCDNKDDFRNKRLELAGELLGRELRAHIRHAERRMVKAIQRDLNGDRDLQELERYVDASIITNGLNRAFSTGSWCHPYKKNERCSGIVATLRRTNPLQMMSDLRKTRQRVAYAGKAGDARYPNPSYWGKLCFMSTPDGENCGLVKNLAVTAIVSSKVVQPLIESFISCGMSKLDEIPCEEVTRMDKIFLNGNWVGSCTDPASFVLRLRCMRRSSLVDPQVEIKRDKHQKEVRVFSDAGRILRPLLVVENLSKIRKPKGRSYSFQELMQQEVVEFIGVEEEEDIKCAWGIRHLFGSEGEITDYTHCELDPSFLLGLSCGIIPFANHNFARRVLYQSEKHSQQAIGYSTTNPLIRVDTLSHQLYYPQKPLFKTVVADCIGRSDYASGRNDDFARPEYFNGQNAIVGRQCSPGI